ncbi:MAG: hypothetical protein IPH28_15075 [Cytophagaceae bacterium]|nr:hypothetical protein [Cytophagaceae bacterium]
MVHHFLASGTPTWNTGQTGSPITVNLTVTTSYSVTCTSGSCNPSNSVGVTITVPTGPCTSVQNNVQLSPDRTGHPLADLP